MDEDPAQTDGATPAAHEPDEHRFSVRDYYNPPSTHRRLRRLPRLVWLAIVVVWRAAPRQLVTSALLQVVTGAALALQLLLMRKLLTELVNSGTPSFRSVLPFVIALSAAGAVSAIAGVLLEAEQRLLTALVGMHTTDQLVQASTRVDLVTYESPVFHDRLQRAQLSAMTRPPQLATGVLGIAGALFAVGGVGFALLLIQPLFLLIVSLGFIPGWLVATRAGRLAYKFSWEQTERDRRRSYIFNVLTRKEEAHEVRAFDLGEFLRKRQSGLFEAMLTDLRKMIRRRLRLALLGQAASAVLGIASIGFLVWMVTDGRIGLATAGTAAGAMVLLAGRLKGLSDSISGIYEGTLYLEDYASFIAATPRSAEDGPLQPAPERLDHVVARDVSFTYPSRTEPSLIDASLELNRGEVVALVGENGSGKSTFAKLLADLYQPESGCVTWDGVDTRSIESASARTRVAVIFQDFVRWQLSAYDNIALGNHDAFDDREDVFRAAKEADIHDALQSLPSGYETLLGPQFYGGSSLSGGQWQRIGLARAFFRDAPLIILDEPTASLDAKAEAALYANMGELFRGRGVLLISHRFGSVRTADRIYVLDKGRVVEVGTHSELVALNGYYAELYRLQARWYVD